jgi:hypothetical protein
LSVTVQERTAVPPANDSQASWLPRADVPILINSFNRLDCLRELISWLVRAGQRRLYVIDNASSYPPLLAYLDRLEANGVAAVVRLGENAGHLSLWRHRLLERLGITSEYVYTDPDVVPAETCPPDVVGFLQSLLAANDRIAVAGLGLRLDDLPDSYRFKAQAIAWERQFWLAPAGPSLFHAPIDTTFALYRPGSGHCLSKPGIRTGWPWVAAHRSWYVDDGRPPEEDRFYRATAARGTSHWSVPELPESLAEAARARAQSHPRLLQVTRPGLSLPGYLSASPDQEIDLPARSVDGIYFLGAPATLAGSPRLRGELRRVAKAGGRMIAHLIGPLHAAIVGEILRQEQGWMHGWRLRRAVLASHAGTGWAGARQPHAAADGLMLHLEPASREVTATPPDIYAAHLDYWPGFTAVPA